MRDPRKILFTAQRLNPGMLHDGEDECNGCIFEKERHKVCVIAGEEASKRKLPDCELGFVYKEVETDPRQIDIFKENTP